MKLTFSRQVLIFFQQTYGIQVQADLLDAVKANYFSFFLILKAQPLLSNCMFTKAHLSCQALNFNSFLSIVKLPKSLFSYLAYCQMLFARCLSMQFICNDLANYFGGQELHTEVLSNLVALSCLLTVFFSAQLLYSVGGLV